MSWEVWTMKSRMSFFNPTLLRKNVGRFAPLWAVLLGILLITGPFLFLQELLSRTTVVEDRVAAIALSTKLAFVRDYFDSFTKSGLFTGFCAAILCAAMVFKYLHRTRSAYMMHAFPMTRTCQFITNALTGFLFYAAPVLIMGAAYEIVLLANGLSACSGLLWTGILRWGLQFLFFYGLAVFCMVLSGRTVISVLSYVAVNFIGFVLPMMVLAVCRSLFYGLAVSSGLTKSLTVLSPLLRLMFSDESAVLLTWIYALVGLVFLALAWYHNRVRHMERAGDAMAYGWARVAFRLLFTACCALGIGIILTTVFSLAANLGNMAWLLLFNTLIGCFLGWFGSSMMLERTVKVFGKRRIWLGFGVFAAVLAVFILGLRYDILGAQRRIPEAASVESVEISSNGFDLLVTKNRRSDAVCLTEKQDVELIRTVHSHALQDREKELDGDRYFSDGLSAPIHIRYHLKGGGTLDRVYEVFRTEDAEQIGKIYSRPAVAEAYYRAVVPDRIFGATVSGDLYYKEDNYDWQELNCKDPAGLKAAILADAAAGRLPVVNEFTSASQGAGVFDLMVETAKDRLNPEWIEIFDTATQTLSLFEDPVTK